MRGHSLPPDVICDVTPGGCIRSRFAVLLSMDEAATPEQSSRDRGCDQFFVFIFFCSSLLQTSQKGDKRNSAKGNCRIKSTREKAWLPFRRAAPLGSALRRINNGFPWPEDSTKASNTAGHSDQHPVPLKPGTWPSPDPAAIALSSTLAPPCFVQPRVVSDHAPAPSTYIFAALFE